MYLLHAMIFRNELFEAKNELLKNKFDNTIIQYEYNIDLNIYNKDKLINKDLLKESNLKYYNEYINTNIFTELLQKDILEEYGLIVDEAEDGESAYNFVKFNIHFNQPRTELERLLIIS